MPRRKIEIEKGAILPIKRGLWVAAVEKLEEVEIGVLQMQNAGDRIQYESGWAHFVDSLEEFWSRFFDEGKRQFPNFQPWAGGIVSERKRDPLLQYLKQARHQSQHGKIALDWEEGSLQIAPGFSGHLRSLKIYSDESYEMDATPLHTSSPEATVVHSPGNAKLPTIENKKFGQKFSPPSEHKGAKLVSSSPVEVAKLALHYYRHVLENAFDKFEPRH